MIKFIEQGQAPKLDYIQRFNGLLTLHSEAVSTHSFWVAFYCNLLVRDLFWLPFKTCETLPITLYYEIYNFIARYALLHDYEEVFGGDILFDAKYHKVGGADIRKGLHNIIQSEVANMPPSVLKLELRANLTSDDLDGTTALPGDIKIVCHNIVKLCDWISSYHFCYQEVCLGNLPFGMILQRVTEGIKNSRVSLLSALEASHLPYSASALESII